MFSHPGFFGAVRGLSSPRAAALPPGGREADVDHQIGRKPLEIGAHGGESRGIGGPDRGASLKEGAAAHRGVHNLGGKLLHIQTVAREHRGDGAQDAGTIIAHEFEGGE